MTKQTSQASISTIGIDIGKNSFHVIGFDERGAIVLRQKLSRGQIAVRFANLSRRLQALGHDVRIMPALYVKPYLKGQKNDFRDAEAIAEAVQRPTMRFVPTKTVEQLDLQALHRLRTRLIRQRTAVINQIRAFLLERGFAVRQGPNPLRRALPEILANPGDELSPRMIQMIEGLCGDWHHFDHRVDDVPVRPFLHLSIHLADLGGAPYMFESPQADASNGNLQACFISPATVEHAPGNAGQFVGQCDDQDTRMQSFGRGFQPTAKTVVGPVLRAHQDSPGPLDEERPEMLVAALGDAAQGATVHRQVWPISRAARGAADWDPGARQIPAPEETPGSD